MIALKFLQKAKQIKIFSLMSTHHQIKTTHSSLDGVSKGRLIPDGYPNQGIHCTGLSVDTNAMKLYQNQKQTPSDPTILLFLTFTFRSKEKKMP